MRKLSTCFAAKGWLTLLLSVIALAYSHASFAQWNNAYFRGTPNNWSATAMTKNTATGLWETRQNFAGTNARFKVSRYTDNWNEAYPAQDFLIATLGDYHIAFNDTSKAISAVRLSASVAATSVCFNNPNNFANPTIYFWAPTPSGAVSNLPAWPGRAMTKVGNYFCYDLASHLVNGVLPTSLGVIFSNNGANQTANLTFNGSGAGAGCYENAVWKSLPQCGFYLTSAASSSSVSSAIASSIATSVASSVASSVAQTISANSICFNNPANYANPSIYFWNPIPAGSLSPLPAWPGKSMTKRGVFYCYDFSADLVTGVMPTSLDIIFNNTGAPQSANLKFTGAGCYENTVWKTLAQCGFSTVAASSSVAVSSSAAPSSSSAPSSVAPSSSVASSSAVSSSVVSSSAVASSVAATSTTVYFKNTANWASVNLHFFNAVPARTGSVWPGVVMQRLSAGSNLFSYQFTGSLTSAGMVFSANGNPKTGDLNFVAPNTCYDFGTTSWKTPAACGVPTPLVANAGVDRKANQNTRQALSAAASTGEYTTASWTSPAWTGALVGKQVVTPVLANTGNVTVTLTLTAANGATATDTMVINVVAATQGLPERPQLAAPLGFPINGTVSSGKYRFVNAFPALESYFFSPVMVTNDGLNDLVYVVDKEGAIYAFPNKESVVASEVRKLLDIKATVLNNNESGMLSMAFDPNYASNGFIYIYYIFGETDNFYPRTDGIVGGKTGDAIIERWTVDNPANPTSAGSKVELLRIPQLGEDHKGGMMQFHPTEGYLYVGIGEGGYGHSAFPQNPLPSDPYQRRHNNSAQDPTTLRGKFIRIQPLATPVNGKYYSVPADNPFVGQAGYLPEIWSMGHRNPWRWAFDTDAPYTLWETEIGQDTDLAYEEVNIITKGQNYGWPVCEGTRNRGALGGAAGKNCLTDYVPPREGYGRTSGVSIIGGFVYRGTQLPALNGSFIFGDYVTKRLWSVSNDGQAKKLISEAFPYYISSIGKDLQKNLLISSHGRELGGPSSIFKMVDDDVATAQIPTKLSATGLFADLTNQIPAHGVIEYSLNSGGWFDGGKMRHFIALPNSSKVGFDPTALWSLPVGSVVVKHLAVATATNANKPFTTSVLFRQETGWQAANYYWNSAGTEADLVTESAVVPDGGSVNVTRKVETGSTCGGCHKNTEGQLTPLALSSRQLNGSFDYQGVNANQLTVLNSIGLFSSAIGNASSYAHFAAPTDSSASLTERAKAYLDVNCAHCHAGTSGGMDLRFDTALESMRVMSQNNRVIPGIPANSNIYKYQTGSGMRMPFGSTVTNPQAEALFRNWINALGVDVVQTGVALSATKTSAEVNEVIGLSLAMVYSNSTQLPAVGEVSWSSSNPAIISTAGKTGASINLTALATGTVTITASSEGFSNSITLEVVPPSNPITALTIVGRANLRLLAGETHQLALVATAANGPQGMTSRVVWTSSNPQVANVSATGLVTAGTTAGTATISALYGDLTTSYTVTGLGQGQYVYVKKPATWSTVSAYVWTNQNGVETARTGPWPGAAVTEVASAYGSGWLRLVIPASWANSSGVTNLIFSNAGANQTANLTVTQAQPRWYDNAWLAAEPAAAAVETGTQIQVGNGTASIGTSGNLSGKLFVAGTLLDIKANPAGPGMQFVHWEGTGAAYLLDVTQPDTKMVVGNALSLTLLAVFDTVTDQHEVARGHYQSQGCVACHGSDGLSGTYKLSNQALASRYTQQQLADYIATNMPKDTGGTSLGTCTGSCATSIASMILADAILPPAGVCDAESLEDVIPQDRSFRLLSALEYNNSVRDLLGLTSNIDVTSGRIPADLAVNGFKTNANAVFTNDYAKGYVLAAEAAAALVTNLYSLTPGCSNATCFVQNFGKRAFRRPLSSTEVTKLVALHTAQGDLALLTAILSSPAMLYRSEVGVPKGNYYELTDYEVATLLSYTYWATTPDASLMAAADAGQLSTPEQIATRVRAMLQDPKAQVAFERFITGWLDLDKEIKTTAISSSLKADMKAETIEFVKRTVFGGGNYKDLLTANYSYMTQQMANHYGLTWPGGSGVQRVDYSGVNAERRGVLGHAGILAIQSASEKTHPVKRGLFVRRSLLCQDFPPPPVGAELKPQEDPSLTVRERFENAHLQQGCESCHQYIDGIGFGLENYNALGLYVTTETTDNGLVKAINSLGEIGSLNSAETYLSESEPVTMYHGMDELTELLAQSPNAQACYARQWYRYARGQREEASDSCTLQVFGRDFKNASNANLLDLMVEFTQTKNYILRK
ncbi:starch-binding protein [Cellvibrio fontiphilus]|uniref:Starch-binding protein n=1 Tax=Cellvibrio fontiphilus TaxID=1815559 RepID=A0ABV7FHA0_9GAMM